MSRWYTVDDPAELRLLRELEAELRSGRNNKPDRLTVLLKQLDVLRGHAGR